MRRRWTPVLIFAGGLALGVAYVSPLLRGQAAPCLGRRVGVVSPSLGEQSEVLAELKAELAQARQMRMWQEEVARLDCCEHRYRTSLAIWGATAIDESARYTSDLHPDWRGGYESTYGIPQLGYYGGSVSGVLDEFEDRFQTISTGGHGDWIAFAPYVDCGRWLIRFLVTRIPVWYFILYRRNIVPPGNNAYVAACRE